MALVLLILYFAMPTETLTLDEIVTWVNILLFNLEYLIKFQVYVDLPHRNMNNVYLIYQSLLLCSYKNIHKWILDNSYYYFLSRELKYIFKQFRIYIRNKIYRPQTKINVINITICLHKIKKKLHKTIFCTFFFCR